MPGINRKTSIPRFRRCHHIGLIVRDLKKMSTFYRHRFGFKLKQDFVADKTMMKKIFGINSSCRVQSLFLDEFLVELFYFQDVRMRKPPVQASGYHHFALVVDHKAAFCRSLEKKKIRVIRIKKPHGTTYFVRDPESNSIEIKEF